MSKRILKQIMSKMVWNEKGKHANIRWKPRAVTQPCSKRAVCTQNQISMLRTTAHTVGELVPKRTQNYFSVSRTDLGLSIFQSPCVAFLPLSTKEPMNRCILSLVWLKDSVDKLNAKLIPKDKLHFSHFLSMGERWQWWGKKPSMQHHGLCVTSS